MLFVALHFYIYFCQILLFNFIYVCVQSILICLPTHTMRYICWDLLLSSWELSWIISSNALSITPYTWTSVYYVDEAKLFRFYGFTFPRKLLSLLEHCLYGKCSSMELTFLSLIKTLYCLAFALMFSFAFCTYHQFWMKKCKTYIHFINFLKIFITFVCHIILLSGSCL